MEKNKLKYCKNCDIDIEIEKNTCPQCGRESLGYNIPEMKNSKLAILASIVLAGLGQFYTGEQAKGFVLMIAQIILILMTVSSFTLLFILPLGLLLWSAYDAYDTAERLNFVIALDKKSKKQERQR